jgi:hypothetical protein
VPIAFCCHFDKERGGVKKHFQKMRNNVSIYVFTGRTIKITLTLSIEKDEATNPQAFC